MDEARLKSVPLFAGVSGKQLAALAMIADDLEVPEGTELVREGEFSYEFFVIESGRAEVLQGERSLAELGPGEFLGEMGLLGQTTRNATVVARSPMSVIVMTGSAFRQLRRDHPDVAARIEDACRERGRALAPMD